MALTNYSYIKSVRQRMAQTWESLPLDLSSAQAERHQQQFVQMWRCKTTEQRECIRL